MKPSQTLERLIDACQAMGQFVQINGCELWLGEAEVNALRAAVALAEAVEGMPALNGTVKHNEKGVPSIEYHVADVKLCPLEKGEWAVEVWSEFDYAEDGPSWFYTGPTPLAALQAAGLGRETEGPP